MPVVQAAHRSPYPPHSRRFARARCANHAFVASLQGKLRLFFLRPYSPEPNPDELVWNDVKNNGVARTPIHGPADLMCAVLGRLRYLQKTPQMVRSFFQPPETRDAAYA